MSRIALAVVSALCAGCGPDFSSDPFNANRLTDTGVGGDVYGAQPDGAPIGAGGGLSSGGSGGSPPGEADGSADPAAGSGGKGRSDGGVTGGAAALDDAGASDGTASERDAGCGGNSCPACIVGTWPCCTLNGACGCAWSTAPTAQCF